MGLTCLQVNGVHFMLQPGDLVLHVPAEGVHLLSHLLSRAARCTSPTAAIAHAQLQQQRMQSCFSRSFVRLHNLCICERDAIYMTVGIIIASTAADLVRDLAFSHQSHAAPYNEVHIALVQYLAIAY